VLTYARFPTKCEPPLRGRGQAISTRLMSALGQKRTSGRRPLMSDVPPKVDIQAYSITSSAVGQKAWRHRLKSVSNVVMR
jgi:hypothetical protein